MRRKGRGKRSRSRQCKFVAKPLLCLAARADGAENLPVRAMSGADIYLVRHGETVWNMASRFQGALDSPLTEKGHAQARSTGRLLASLLPACADATLVVSPLGRAQATAAA